MMCLASKYLSQLEKTITSIKSDTKKLSNKLSEYDKGINEIYHQIEISKFNACEGFHFAKKLQEILQKRRLVKSELYRLDLLHKTLSRSVGDRVNNAKKVIDKSVNKKDTEEWRSNFGFTFSDIEEEILH